LLGSWLRCRSPSGVISTSDTRPVLQLIAKRPGVAGGGLLAGGAQGLHQPGRARARPDRRPRRGGP
jgi:hypothetical protein